jgi:DNA repair protein RecO (recombination protein O)
MYVQSKIIILSYINFSEADIIVKCFSKEKGKLTFMVKGVRKAGKKKNSISYFQPLNVLQAGFLYRENKQLLFFKDLDIEEPLSSIYEDIKKSTVVMFLSEVIESAIQEEEINEQLFSYLENAIHWLDTHQQTQNFHIAFLLRFSRYLGIYPELNQLKELIDENNNQFENDKLTDKNLLKLSELIKRDIDITNCHNIKINKQERLNILEFLLLYYRKMLPGFRFPNSFAVVKDIFA